MVKEIEWRKRVQTKLYSLCCLPGEAEGVFVSVVSLTIWGHKG